MMPNSNPSSGLLKCHVFAGLRALSALFLCYLATACAKREAPDPAVLIPDWRTYYNQEVGIELKYPYTLSLEVESGAGDGQLVVELQWRGSQTPVFKLETRPASQPEEAIPPSDATELVGGLPASRVEIDGTDGEIQERLSLTRNGTVFVFTGSGESFEKVLRTIRFLP